MNEKFLERARARAEQMRTAEERTAAQPKVERYRDGTPKNAEARAAQRTDVEHMRDSQEHYEAMMREHPREAQVLLDAELARLKAAQLEAAKKVGQEYVSDPAAALRAERNAQLDAAIAKLEAQRPTEPEPTESK